MPTSMRSRAPHHPALAGVVTLLWAGTSPGNGGYERIVPTGHLHLAWRTDAPMRFGLRGAQVERFGVIGGVRQTAHVHDTPPCRSIGLMLAAGATSRLLGAPASAFAGSHIGLEAIWGGFARDLTEQLAARDDAAALDHLEACLVARLRPSPSPPGLRHALARLEQRASVQDVAVEVGRSPRTLRGWFLDAVGCSPATWGRLRRMQGALSLAERELPWADVALGAGYFDQPHLCREFQRIVGVTPSQWRGAATSANHVPIADRYKPQCSGTR